MSQEKIRGLQLEEISLLRQLEANREQARLLAGAESILQANLSTCRAKLAGVKLAQEAAAEAAAVPAPSPAAAPEQE